MKVEVEKMLYYNGTSYGAMLGNINEKMMKSSASCISQCTGCMCNCRCSCSGGKMTDFEWEVI